MNWFEQLTAEEKISLSLIRNDGSLAKLLRQNVIQPNDNEKLLKHLNWNRLSPFLYYTIQKYQNKFHFSGEMIAAIKQGYDNSIIRTMQIEGVFRKLIPLLLENQIQVNVLKGIVFANTIYPEPQLRPMLDIDILIDRNDIQKAQSILQKAGCSQKYEMESATVAENMPHTAQLFYRDIPIEIHHNLFMSYDRDLISLEEIVEKCVPVTIYGINCYTLSPEHTLFYLLYHLQKHAEQGYIKLIWLLDIMLWYQNNQQLIDNAIIERMLTRQSNSIEIFKTFLSVKEILNIKVVDSHKTVSLPVTDGMILFYLSRSNNRRMEALRIYSLNDLIKLKTIKNKLKFITGRLFPGKSYVKYRFNVKYNFMLPVYYCLIYGTYLKKIILVLLFKIKQTLTQQDLKL